MSFWWPEPATVVIVVRRWRNFRSAVGIVERIMNGPPSHCTQCGKGLKQEVLNGYEAKYLLDFRETATLTRQIRAHFFDELQKVVEAELDHRGYRKYFDHFYKCGLYKKFDVRTEQLAEEVYGIHCRQNGREQEEIDGLLQHSFQSFIDYYLIVYAEPIHQLQLPQAILRYQDAEWGSVDQRQMILDFLDFANEPDKVYTDFFRIPERKVRNASQSFLFPQADEKVFFICDQTVFGSCKEGFAMTDRGLYWKSHFNPAQQVQYADLENIRRESEWLRINDQFFNVSKSINVKMLKLLKRIREGIGGK